MNYVGMKRYVGVKTINARPCTAKEAKGILGRELCLDNADPEGNGYLVKYKDGYTSWSPKDAFEEAYREVEGICFGTAIELLKQGKKVARSGWNGKGMYLALQLGSVIDREKARGGVAKCCADEGENEIRILPHIDMKAANGEVVVGWLASQTDMLSEDWHEVE